jgi:hypothetical protein
VPPCEVICTTYHQVSTDICIEKEISEKYKEVKEIKKYPQRFTASTEQ